MIRNYFKIAMRNLAKNKLYTFIVITGLSIGITCCLLITLFIQNEMSYDDFQQKGNRTARVIMDYSIGGNGNKGNYTSVYVGPSFKKNFPEVENFVRLSMSPKVVRLEDRVFIENSFLYADSTFFDVFSFSLLNGNKKTALIGPNKVVLTEKAAQKYFGNINPVGKTLKISGAGVDYEVTGIIQNCPENSHIKFDFLASFSSFGLKTEKMYWNANYVTYLLLKNESDIARLQAKIPGFMKSEMKDQLTGNDRLTYELEPLKRIHLYSPYDGFEPNGSINYVYVLAIVALLILTIASFTFINLSTARSAERAKEIGIRKVSGAHKNQIFIQFMTESVSLVLLSFTISVILVMLFLPYFNNLVERNISLSSVFSMQLLYMALALILGISLLSGIYPALILSSFKPVSVLKGAFKNSENGLMLRKFLFSFQFVISVFLIIATYVVQKQLNYFNNKDLGYNKQQVLVLPYDSKVYEHYDLLKQTLKQNNAVKYVARADFEPGNVKGGYNMYEPLMPPNKSYGVQAGTIDEEYLNACGIQLIAGSNITKQDVAEASKEDYEKCYYHFILNESAARQLGWSPKEAIGKKMFLDASRPGEVKGVVKDFHHTSLHNPIKPMLFFPSNYANFILVKLSTNNMTSTLSSVEHVWKDVVKHRPFEYSFLDDNYASFYKSETKLSQALTVFALIAILLAIFGLFGLASYTIKQRDKEISIRKVLGASVSAIVLNLSKSFLRMILVSCIVAVPLVWWVLQTWLQNYAYRISISPWYFILPSLILISLAFATIAIRAIKASMVNPIKNLRTE